MKVINISEYIIPISLLIFVAGVLLGVDFGAFERDYYEAHSLGMDHLSNNLMTISERMLSIPNSASGVFPLWIMGHLDSLTMRVLFSALMLVVFILAVYTSSLEVEVKRVFVGSLLISPMIMSSTAWALPEVTALAIVGLSIATRKSKFNFFSYVLSFLVPWSRQTFIVFLGLSFFDDFKITRQLLFSCIFGSVGLGMLVYFWGGIVPPNLTEVHLTPSLKPVTTALLIFCLYFGYFGISELAHFELSKKVLLKLLLVAAIIIIDFLSPPLFGGGYIFSRLSSFNSILSITLQACILFVVFNALSFRLIGILMFLSLTFATTNYMFLKYVDFYMPILLLTLLTFMPNSLPKVSHLKVVQSVLFFQAFSLTVAIIFYYIV